MNRPTIVCLCGSTKFRDEFMRANAERSLAGEIVLSVGFFMHAERRAITAAEKLSLDELHKRKIDLADYVLVLNVDDYIGESTASEIAYARAHGKPIRFLEPSTHVAAG